jgi:hypothetical protein
MQQKQPSRTPPIGIIRALRHEVGFGCPVPGCENPLLSWHHFDPPWEPLHQHNLAGMVALCLSHHKQADSGAFTKEQLRQFKTRRATGVRERFNWLRNSSLIIAGGNIYYQAAVVLQLCDRPVIWFERDREQNLLLNVDMISLSSEPRAYVQNNDWIVEGDPTDLESPPSGKLLKVGYPGGDRDHREGGFFPNHCC